MRFVAQRYGTWETVDRDLPITITSGPEWGLSMFGLLEGTIAPEVADATAEDGHPVVAEWGTIIACDTDNLVDRRRWQGIVTEVKPEGKLLRVKAIELAGYPEGLTFTGDVHGVQIDPVQAVRLMWEQMQSLPGGDMGVTVVGATPLRVGTDSEVKLTAATSARDAAKLALDAVSKPRMAAERRVRAKRAEYLPQLRPLETLRDAATRALDAIVGTGTPAEVAAARLLVETRQAALVAKREERDTAVRPLETQVQELREAEEPWRDQYDTAEEAYRAAQDQVRKDGGALKIESADFPDAGAEIRKLAIEYGFELTTRYRWSEGRPDCELVAHYPKAGRARPDLLFQQGQAIISELKPRSDVYASEVLGKGAGEGADAVRASAARTDWRARRTSVLARPDMTTAAALRGEVRRELGWSGGGYEIPSIIVQDHELAPLGSWSVGDSILVQGSIPHVGAYSEWHRIMSWRMLSDSTAELSLERVVQA